MDSSLDQNDQKQYVRRDEQQTSQDASIDRNHFNAPVRFDHNESSLAAHLRSSSETSQNTNSQYSGVITNESLLDGFSLLRLVQQVFNPDIYYIGLVRNSVSPAASLDDYKVDNKIKQAPDIEEAWSNVENTESETNSIEPSQRRTATELLASIKGTTSKNSQRKNILEEVAAMNPLRRCLDSSRLLQSITRILTIALSLIAIMISIDKTLSTILLCLFSRSDIRHQSAIAGKPSMPYEASDISMSWFVLVLNNLSSTYILMSTVFNGHLLWHLLNQRLFLVARKFQYKTMLSLLVFAYLEYMINISFINNLFGWSFETEDIESNGKKSTNNLHDSYSILSRLEIFVTDQDSENSSIDIILTILQFSRGVIRISPYIIINYVIICLSEHIKTIRNQDLLTDSLKKKQKLRLVVKSSRAAKRLAIDDNGKLSSTHSMTSNGLTANGRGKKRVIFATDNSTIGNYTNNITNYAGRTIERGPLRQLQLGIINQNDIDRSQTPSSIHSSNEHHHDDGSMVDASYRGPILYQAIEKLDNNWTLADGQTKNQYCDRIRDFYELESYITNLYIFTGRLNRLMSRQGLTMFFIVHNLVISCSLIVPEAIRGGSPMVFLIRLLVIITGIVPFICGQSLNGQLEQLSKQIDRIIIHQQFFGRRRDNLVRIRELLHDIRVNCGGMLNFNIETGLKFLVIAFASAFFIEQEECPGQKS